MDCRCAPFSTIGRAFRDHDAPTLAGAAAPSPLRASRLGPHAARSGGKLSRLLLRLNVLSKGDFKQPSQPFVPYQGSALERLDGLGVRPFRTITPISMEASKSKKNLAAKEAAPAPHDEKRKPVSTIRVDDCSASIWAREFVVQGQPKVFYSLTLERSYKDRDGAWKYTKSFDADSLGKVVSLCQQASETINGLQQHDAA